MTTTVIGENFDDEVLRATSLVVVNFIALWSGPCRILEPLLESAIDELGSHVKFVQVDVDASRELANRYDIRSMPTLVLFKRGSVVARQVGIPRLNLENWISRYT